MYMYCYMITRQYPVSLVYFEGSHFDSQQNCWDIHTCWKEDCKTLDIVDLSYSTVGKVGFR